MKYHELDSNGDLTYLYISCHFLLKLFESIRIFEDSIVCMCVGGLFSHLLPVLPMVNFVLQGSLKGSLCSLGRSCGSCEVKTRGEDEKPQKKKNKNMFTPATVGYRDEMG